MGKSRQYYKFLGRTSENMSGLQKVSIAGPDREIFRQPWLHSVDKSRKMKA